MQTDIERDKFHPAVSCLFAGDESAPILVLSREDAFILRHHSDLDATVSDLQKLLRMRFRSGFQGFRVREDSEKSRGQYEVLLPRPLTLYETLQKRDPAKTPPSANGMCVFGCGTTVGSISAVCSNCGVRYTWAGDGLSMRLLPWRPERSFPPCPKCGKPMERKVQPIRCPEIYLRCDACHETVDMTLDQYYGREPEPDWAKPY